MESIIEIISNNDTPINIETDWGHRRPQVVRLGAISRHPNADTLEISSVLGDNTVIFKENQYKEGDLVSYLPSDTICSSHPVFDFLGEKKRVKVMKLRGVFSEGILVPAPPDTKEGDSVIEYYNLTKHQYEEEVADRVEANTEGNPKHFYLAKYDLESLRNNLFEFQEGDEVIIHEKLEGENMSILHDGEKLWVKSRNLYKKEDPDSHWWKPVLVMNLKEKLAAYPMFAFKGEKYGITKPFYYDAPKIDNVYQSKIRIFDIYDTKKGQYLHWDKVLQICSELELETVPELYRGGWKADKSLYQYAEGKSTLGNHCREGMVIRSLNPYMTHKIYKLKGMEYSLFKAKKS